MKMCGILAFIKLFSLPYTIGIMSGDYTLYTHTYSLESDRLFMQVLTSSHNLNQVLRHSEHTT